MLSPTAKTVAFKDHIEATVDLNIPIDTCNSLEAYVDYLAATIAVAARRATHPPHHATFITESHRKISSQPSRTKDITLYGSIPRPTRQPLFLLI